MNEKHVMIDRHQYELQTAELCDLRQRNKDLEWVLSVVSGLHCSRLHHAAKDRHEYDESCPVEDRILRIINREAAANG